MRSIGSSRNGAIKGLAIYDMRNGSGWEDVPADGMDAGNVTDDGEADDGPVIIDARQGVDDDQSERREYTPNFPISEIAVDPGQDLLIVTEVE